MGTILWACQLVQQVCCGSQVLLCKTVETTFQSVKEPAMITIQWVTDMHHVPEHEDQPAAAPRESSVLWHDIYECSDGDGLTSHGLGRPPPPRGGGGGGGVFGCGNLGYWFVGWCVEHFSSPPPPPW